jgi:diguanylate cyclase (GGDEF)-like protein
VLSIRRDPEQFRVKESDSESMEDTIDEPTGMLPGDSLPLRARELSHQSRRCLEPVGMIVGQLDPLEASLDGQRGALLREVAAVLLSSLRPFDLAYRVDEERFVVLLPGADHERAGDTAERLRRSVEAAGLAAGGVTATMSFGFGASREGWWFDYASVRREADAALAEARRCGNGVCGG